MLSCSSRKLVGVRFPALEQGTQSFRSIADLPIVQKRNHGFSVLINISTFQFRGSCPTAESDLRYHWHKFCWLECTTDSYRAHLTPRKRSQFQAFDHPALLSPCQYSIETGLKLDASVPWTIRNLRLCSFHKHTWTFICTTLINGRFTAANSHWSLFYQEHHLHTGSDLLVSNC